jgi:hypothetical protein
MSVVTFLAPARPVGSFFGMSCDLAQLRREASALHRVAFNRDVPDEVTQRYAEAHHVAFSRVDVTDSEWMQRALEEGTDLEALEVALRSRQPDHVLCHKFKLLIYIAEAFPQYYVDFVNEEQRRFQGFYSLALHGLRAVYKYLKGRWLLRTLV